jgi:hypothetical protein
MLHAQRNRCHPYCHAKHRVNYPPAARIDEPAQTKAGKRKDDLEQLLILVQTAVKFGRLQDSEIIKHINEMKNQE